MESWRKVWREGVALQLSDTQLRSLLRGLESDDKRLIQGATTVPPPLLAVQDWQCEGACLIGYSFAFEEDPGPGIVSLKNVREVEEFFARVCFQADEVLGEPAGVRYLLNWFDETTRGEVRRELIAEVTRTLEQRSQDAVA